MKVVITLILLAVSFHLPALAQERDSLDIMIGQMILVGIGDFDVLRKNEPVFQYIEEGKVGGIILFEKNISAGSPKENLRQIISFAQKKAAIPLFVSIDEEGGKVNRLKPRYGFPKTVKAQYLGDVDQLDTTRLYAENTASALEDLGINMNFAPSVDVNINPANPVIGSIGRSFSEDFRKVARHAGEVVKVHDRHRVATVLKHFPGHGSSKNDTHLGLADVSDTWQIEELFPYKILMDSGLVRAIMTAHIVNRSLDEHKLPATLSYKVVTGLLRQFMEYEGVVVSDDMQMGAISKHYGLEEAIRLCVNAGVDILLFANNVPDSELVTAGQIHSIIRQMVVLGEINRDRIVESYQRIMKLKAEMGLVSPAR